MKIAALIKQVPATMAVTMDEESGTLKRSGLKAKLNPYDLFALECALGVREKYGGTLTAVSMGPPAAKESLLEAVYMGADDACLVTDAAFAGSDVLATSRALAEALKALGGFDLVVCGKQTTDGDTAQTGPQIAEWLGIPHSSGVASVQSAGPEGLTLIAETEEQRRTLFMPFPCVICVDKDINTPRLPSFLRKRVCSEDAVRLLSIEDFYDKGRERYGLDGSPTRVVRIFEPDARGKSLRLEGDPSEVAARLVTSLREEKLL
ncbi:MAG: electron transfer flavoprotein subunit beta/FixA family protein [Oscillospiraceae bacterium]|nr:electron transfer flavoprotein subunit beta/FixA family protein [Oscillospiraceae bacterium]